MTADEIIAFEKSIADLFNARKIKYPIHLDGGNIYELVRVFEKFRSGDHCFCSWRSHAKALLAGISPELVKSEIMAGHSISLCFPEYRFFSSAIVGGNLPIAIGAAWAIRRRGGSEHVWAFCGDMTEKTGIFHECVQYASGFNLPITFVIEDNNLSVCTPTQDTWGTSIERNTNLVHRFTYKPTYPHAGAGVRVSF